MDLLFLLLCASVISFFIFPIVIKFAYKYGYVDDPKVRKHPAILKKEILPRAGGVAPFLAILITSLLFLPFEKRLFGLLLGAAILLLFNTLDDKYDLHPLIRLFAGFLAATVVIVFGIGITSLDLPFFGTFRLDIIDIPINFLGIHHFFPLADLLALFWIMALTNFVNWSSGVDGQLPTIVIICFVFLAILASQFVSYDPSQWTIIRLCLIAIGAVIPLLIYNWFPARILPGDGASTSLALIIAALAIYSGSKTATAILLLGIPIMDGLWAIGRRILKGKSPIWGDREHLHHRLLDIGWSHPQISLFYGAITFILGLIAVYSSRVTKLWAIVATAFFLFVITLTLFLLGKKKK